MIVLLVGSGGREHALAWKIVQSPTLTRLVVAPGNPGIGALAEVRPVRADDVEGLLALAREIAADLVVVGPEAALERGLADRLAEAGIACFGPTASAARLESSKAFTKAFADRWSLPTAEYVVITSMEGITPALKRFKPPYVIKADGLAAGKGVQIIDSETDADAWAAVMNMLGGALGKAGARVVMEAFMEGEEASMFALCDGVTAIPFGQAQDHKRAHDGDTGLNTGGMGTYSPAPVLTAAVAEAAFEQMVEPTVRGMAVEGSPYRGVLYAGLMIGAGGPRLVEYNARFGDPECQVLMLRLESDLLPYLHAAATGGLADLPAPRWRDEAAICVVLAAEGYPEAPRTGAVIEGAEADFGPDVVVFHAGVARDAEGRLVAAGGRVLNVCARGETLGQARDRAYAAVACIRLPGGFHRTDIGWRALQRPG
ncbi:phosphoribosylamine--glycine ligase [Caulobacter sp. S45]|uniref:phosphoribosylamine--glycine ligase n=1 Tax=Caulobacter sp. S45 TaxID=1641861 RepID=UPI00157556D6|nr:phosphoribosylamine--glycine ligase [Caulobacter sp. S45]